MQARAAEIEAKGGHIDELVPLNTQINLPAFESPQLVTPVAPFNTSAMVNYSRTYPSNLSSASQQAPFIAHQGQKPIKASLHVSEAKSLATVSGSATQQNISGGSTQAVSTLCHVIILLVQMVSSFLPLISFVFIINCGGVNFCFYFRGQKQHLSNY